MGCLNSQPKVEKHFPNYLPEERQQPRRSTEGRVAEINILTKQQHAANWQQRIEKKQAEEEIKEVVQGQIEVNTESPISSLVSDYIWQWDVSSLYAKCFRINEQKGELVKDDACYQIISMPLPHKGSVAATIRIEYGLYSRQGIILGIISQRRKNEQFSRGWHEETVGYATWNNGKTGWISMNGIGHRIQNRNNLFIPHGGLLNLTVDIQKQKIYFTNFSNDQKIVLKLSPSFQNQQLFLFATMTCKGDSVAFL